MPAYNAAATIGASVSSVLTQTYPEVELIVVDDGSTDETREIVEAYGSDRVTLVTQPNRGCATARNTGLAAATGTYVALCDSDDMLLPQHIERSMDLLRESAARTWVCAEALVLTSEGLTCTLLPYGQVPPDEQRFAMLQENFVSVFSVFPKAMAEELGGFTTELLNAEDWDLWLRAVFAGWRVQVQTEPSALYRSHGGGKSRNPERMAIAEQAIFRRLLESQGDRMTAQEREHLDRRLTRGSARELLRRSDEALDSGNWLEASSLIAAAAEDWPSHRRLQQKARILRVFPSASRYLARARK